MSKFDEGTSGVRLIYHKESPKNGTEYEAIKVEISSVLDYSRLTSYIRTWPNKLVSFVSDRICDDDFHSFALELYEYLRDADRDGPAFDTWDG